ncbi:hypothetical protein CQW32_16790 [Pseudomonas putida]|nr:hypothetical protein CQW32_16790 [Pseudomonas putida]
MLLDFIFVCAGPFAGKPAPTRTAPPVRAGSPAKRPAQTNPPPQTAPPVGAGSPAKRPAQANPPHRPHPP